MKPIFLLVCIFFLSSSCTAKNYLYYKHTGYEINNKLNLTSRSINNESTIR